MASFCLLLVTYKCWPVKSRSYWGARNRTGIRPELVLPAKYIYIVETGLYTCNTTDYCINRVREVQNYDMGTMGSSINKLLPQMFVQNYAKLITERLSRLYDFRNINS